MGKVCHMDTWGHSCVCLFIYVRGRAVLVCTCLHVSAHLSRDHSSRTPLLPRSSCMDRPELARPRQPHLLQGLEDALPLPQLLDAQRNLVPGAFRHVLERGEPGAEGGSGRGRPWIPAHLAHRMGQGAESNGWNRGDTEPKAETRWGRAHRTGSRKQSSGWGGAGSWKQSKGCSRGSKAQQWMGPGSRARSRIQGNRWGRRLEAEQRNR